MHPLCNFMLGYDVLYLGKAFILIADTWVFHDSDREGFILKNIT